MDLGFMFVAGLLSIVFTAALFGANYFVFRRYGSPASAATWVAMEAAGLGLILWVTHYFSTPRTQRH